MKLTASSTGEEIESLALAIHQLVNELPFTMRTKNSKGIRLEEGQVVDYDYTGPILEKVIEKGEKISEIPETGTYEGTPVQVVPIIEDGEVVAAMGVVDITQGIYTDIKEITKRPQEMDRPEGVK
ncbi:MAG TPA: DUF2111 domain-containing protein [Methanobacterium sp.]|jgi:hypothetical protein|nr:MAG: DUF2111 domain-containing protein [Methanobacterium sp.]HOI70778.1 DUF2111 domain-containing protein [Methanobacterium sp.]